MSRARLLVFPLAAAALSVPGCKKTDASANPPQANVPAQPETDASVQPQTGQLVRAQASVEKLDEVLKGVAELTARLAPEQAVDPMAQLQAVLLQLGFGPGFMSSLDLSARHSVEVAFPPEGAGAGGSLQELAAAVGVIDARKLIDSTPPSFRPQPLGEGMWEFRQGDLNLVLQDAKEHLLVGLDRENLQQAQQLAAAPSTGRRVHVRMWDMAPAKFDPAALGLQGNPQLSAAIGGVLDKMTEVEMGLDFAANEDLELVFGAKAPFEQLGLQSLGEPRGAATALEKRLPGDPVALATISLGDLAQAQKMLDQVVAKAIGNNALPPALEEIKTKAMQGVTTLLQQVRNDAVIGFYVDDRGQPAIVLAANVADAAAAQQGLRSLQEAVAKAGEVQAVMYNQQKDAQVKVDLKVDGLKVGAVKGDRLDVTIPKTFEEQLGEWQMLLTKGKLEAVSFVDGDLAVWAFGPNARTLATTIGKNKGGPKQSLAQFKGLELLRTTLGGCQVCATVDVVAYTRLRLQMASESDNAEQAKALKKMNTDLRKLGDTGDAAAGVKVAAQRGEIGFAVPKTLVFASPDTYKKLKEAWQLLDSADDKTELAGPAAMTAPAAKSAPAPAAKPAPAPAAKPAR